MMTLVLFKCRVNFCARFRNNLLLEELIQAVEQRIPGRDIAPEPPPANRGSKQAVLRHFGIFQEDTDLEQQLASIRDYRKTAGE